MLSRPDFRSKEKQEDQPSSITVFLELSRVSQAKKARQHSTKESGQHGVVRLHTHLLGWDFMIHLELLPELTRKMQDSSQSSQQVHSPVPVVP